jgi:hypothetical protein
MMGGRAVGRFSSAPSSPANAGDPVLLGIPVQAPEFTGGAREYCPAFAGHDTL